MLLRSGISQLFVFDRVSNIILFPFCRTTFGEAIRCFIMRRSPLHVLHRSGRLFQMFVTYCLTRKEDINLEYWERTQQRIRSVPYADLMDHVRHHASLNNAVPGRVIVLPRSFGRSQRAYDARLRDELACVQYVGMPHFFITVTANPMWEEVVRARNLCPRDDSNLIDVTNRLLHTKIRAYLKLVLDSYIFGVMNVPLCVCRCYVVHFFRWSSITFSSLSSKTEVVHTCTCC